MRQEHPIEALSNELEFALDGVDARSVIPAAPEALALMEEVNPRDVVEMNVSMYAGPDALARALPEKIGSLRDIVVQLGGRLYGGGAVLADVRDVEPNRRRTTSLSDTLARGFLNISSQQVVLGMTNEEQGLAAYEALKTATPFLFALSLATPYTVEGESLVDTGTQSIRPAQYNRMLARLPQTMWHGIPSYANLAAFRAQLQTASDDVNRSLAAGELDTVPALWEKGYAPFTTLEPHQLYHTIRVRPDHDNRASGGKSVFTLELRAPDMPQTVDAICAINALAYGVASRAASEGVAPLHHTLDLDIGLNGQVHDLIGDVGSQGLGARYVNGQTIRALMPALVSYALDGLVRSGNGESAARLVSHTNTLLQYGTQSEQLRAQRFATPAQARSYLANRLEQSLR